MKLSTTTNNDSIHEWFKIFKSRIEARAGDRIKVEIYPASQLGSAQRTIEGVTMGTVEVAMNASGFYEGLEPRFGVLSATGIFDDPVHGNKVVNDAKARELLAGFGKGKGYEVLSAFVYGPLVLVTKEPYLTADDIKGKKIRVPGSPLYLGTFRGLGAAPLSMTQGEVMAAMQNGTINGAIGGSAIFPALKFYDTAKAMTYLPSSQIAAVSIINSKFLETIGPELRAMVKEAALEADRFIYQWTAEDADRVKATWEQNGGKSYNPQPQEAERFVSIATKVAQDLFNKNPQQAQDYELFRSVAE
jgi:C4-dicarboxylate-binding protein DctP